MTRRDRKYGALPVSIALATVAVLAGCSSRNPDALSASNLDENMAVMDANGTVNMESNVAGTSGATDSNLTVISANADSNSVASTAGESVTRDAVHSDQATIDAAVNTLREADEDQNQYCEAQMQATGESDCDDD